METQVLIIGAGVTGTGLARDLALRGVDCIVVESKDINAGASGANHGLLHSGARYVSNDPFSAQECHVESQLLKKMAPNCIEDTGGLFVAVAGDDEAYVAEFPRLCEQNGISARMLDRQVALELEPALCEDIVAAYQVEDASINPFRLSLENMAEAETLGSRLFTHTEVTGFLRNGSRIQAVRMRQHQGGKETVVEAAQVVNAAGAWAGEVAKLLDLELPMIYSKGSLLVTQRRLTRKVINRLRRPSDGDIVAPGGTVSLVGSTSERLRSPFSSRPTIEEVDRIVTEAGQMVPVLANTRYVRAYAGVRPLVSANTKSNDRAISRGFVVLDHEADGISNLITVTGGKLTTFRLMAEKAADLVCSRLGLKAPCRTRQVPLASSETTQWTEPGLSPRVWLKKQNPDDPLLCECEMVPLSAVDQILDRLEPRRENIDLSAINLRSRVGKGSCQGTFCSFRTCCHLYERGLFHSDEGVNQLKRFLGKRWHGLRPVLWGAQLAQEELQEAIHCGLFGLET
ncbi:MAG: anaerobic glycerol-3-phosphate dehydrogenase subunit A [Deltaproteobacteria bacterium]|nr:MAG: anaerobic glycerol-3-phosphate dehydrogenase subunit A [Deltaproteobacteria bacterium]